MRERKTEGGEEGERERSRERNKEIGTERQKNYVFLKIEMGKNEAWVWYETNKNKKTTYFGFKVSQSNEEASPHY